ncbi:Uncharacterized protein QTN25_010391 [Entamoeba marina]
MHSVNSTNTTVHSTFLPNIIQPFVVIKIITPKPHTFIFPSTTPFISAISTISSFYSFDGFLSFNGIPIIPTDLPLKKLFISPNDSFSFETYSSRSIGSRDVSKPATAYAKAYGMKLEKVLDYVERGVISEQMLKEQTDGNNEKIKQKKQHKIFSENPLGIVAIGNTSVIKNVFESYAQALVQIDWCNIEPFMEMVDGVRHIPFLMKLCKSNVGKFVDADNVISLGGLVLIVPELIKCVNDNNCTPPKYLKQVYNQAIDRLNKLLEETKNVKNSFEISLLALYVYCSTLLLEVQPPVIFSQQYNDTPLSLLFSKNSENINTTQTEPQTIKMEIEQDSISSTLPQDIVDLISKSNVLQNTTNFLNISYDKLYERSIRNGNAPSNIFNYLESPILRILYLQQYPFNDITPFIPPVPPQISDDLYFVHKKNSIIPSLFSALFSTDFATCDGMTQHELISKETMKITKKIKEDPCGIVGVNYFLPIFRQQLSDPSEELTPKNCCGIFFEWFGQTNVLDHFTLPSATCNSFKTLPETCPCYLEVNEGSGFEEFVALYKIEHDYLVMTIADNISTTFPICFENHTSSFYFSSGVFEDKGVCRSVIYKNDSYYAYENKMKTQLPLHQLNFALSGLSSFLPKVLIYRRNSPYSRPFTPIPQSYVPLLPEVLCINPTPNKLLLLEQHYLSVTKQPAYQYLKRFLLKQNPFPLLPSLPWHVAEARNFRHYLRECALLRPQEAFSLFDLELPSDADLTVLHDIADIAATILPLLPSSFQLSSKLLHSILEIPSSPGFESSEAVIPLTRFLSVILPKTNVNNTINNPFQEQNPRNVGDVVLPFNALKAMIVRAEKETFLILNYLTWNNSAWTEMVLMLLEQGLIDETNLAVYIRYAWEMFGLNDDLKEKRVDWMRNKLTNIQLSNYEVAGIIVEVIGGQKSTLQQCRLLLLKEIISRYQQLKHFKNMSYGDMKTWIEQSNDFEIINDQVVKTFIKCIHLINDSHSDNAQPVSVERSIHKMALLKLQAAALNEQLSSSK